MRVRVKILGGALTVAAVALFLHLREQRRITAALESARLAPIPDTATNIVVVQDRRMWFCEIDVSFRDSHEAIAAWMGASPGIEAPPDWVHGAGVYYADNTHNVGANVKVDLGSGKVEIFVAFEECP
jgi:hypothetical protein